MTRGCRALPPTTSFIFCSSALFQCFKKQEFLMCVIPLKAHIHDALFLNLSKGRKRLKKKILFCKVFLWTQIYIYLFKSNRMSVCVNTEGSRLPLNRYGFKVQLLIGPWKNKTIFGEGTTILRNEKEKKAPYTKKSVIYFHQRSKDTELLFLFYLMETLLYRARHKEYYFYTLFTFYKWRKK